MILRLVRSLSLPSSKPLAGALFALAMGAALASCGDSAQAVSDCQAQLSAAQAAFARCTLDAATSEEGSAGGDCSSAYQAEVDRLRAAFGDNVTVDDQACAPSADAAKATTGLAARFLPNAASEADRPRLAVELGITRVGDPLLQAEHRPSWLFPGLEELRDRPGVERVQQSSLQCTSFGWCVDSLPLDRDTPLCIRRVACVAEKGMLVDINSTTVLLQPGIEPQDGMACKLNLSASYPDWAGCFGNPAFLEATYYIVICPES